MGHDLPPENVHVGPSDYVPWLTDRKWAHIRLEGKAFGDVPLTAELKLEVWDSPNSAGVVIDAVRLIKLALNNGIAGPARRSVVLPDEEPAQPAPRRRSAGTDRGIHPRRTSAARRDSAPAEIPGSGRLGPLPRSLNKSPRSGGLYSLRECAWLQSLTIAQVSPHRRTARKPVNRVRRSP